MTLSSHEEMTLIQLLLSVWNIDLSLKDVCKCLNGLSLGMFDFIFNETPNAIHSRFGEQLTQNFNYKALSDSIVDDIFTNYILNRPCFKGFLIRTHTHYLSLVPSNFLILDSLHSVALLH